MRIEGFGCYTIYYYEEYIIFEYSDDDHWETYGYDDDDMYMDICIDSAGIKILTNSNDLLPDPATIEYAFEVWEEFTKRKSKK